jgi:hypothetical protein
VDSAIPADRNLPQKKTRRFVLEGGGAGTFTIIVGFVIIAALRV